MDLKKWLMAAAVAVVVAGGAVGCWYVYKSEVGPAATASGGVRPGVPPSAAPGNGGRFAGVLDMNGITAEALGVTSEQLAQELNSGKTVKDIAEEKGITESQLQEKVLAKIKEKLTQAVAEGKLTQEQSDQMYQRLKDDVTSGRWMQRPPLPAEQPSDKQDTGAQDTTQGTNN